MIIINRIQNNKENVMKLTCFLISLKIKCQSMMTSWGKNVCMRVRVCAYARDVITDCLIRVPYHQCQLSLALPSHNGSVWPRLLAETTFRKFKMDGRNQSWKSTQIKTAWSEIQIGGCQIQDEGNQIQNCGYQIQDGETKSKMVATTLSKFQDGKCLTQNGGCQIENENDRC